MGKPSIFPFDVRAIINKLISTSFAALALPSGSSLIGFIQAGSGSILRTLQAKNRDVISALDFATGDGITDDTVKLQAAATRAGALRADLYIPATGNFYKLTSEITIPAGVRVYGGGHLKQTVVNKNCLVASNDCSIENIKIEGPNLLSTVDIKNTGIEINGVSRVQVRNCDISKFETGGILIRNCFDVLISGNYLHENDWQGSTPGASGGDIYSYSSTASGRIVITENFCMSNSSQGIAVAENGLEQDVIVSNNVCITLDATGAVRSSGTLARRHGIVLGYVSQVFPERRVICANNIIANTLWSGIYAFRFGAQANGPMLINDNLIFDVGYDTTSALSAGVFVATAGTIPTVIRNNTVLRFRNSNDLCGAYTTTTGAVENTGAVIFENNQTYGSLGNGFFVGGYVGRVTINGLISINTTKKDIFFATAVGHAPTEDYVFSGLDIRRNNATDDAVVLTPDASMTRRIIIKNFQIVGSDKTVSSSAFLIKYPLLTDIVDGEVQNFARVTNAISYIPTGTRYFNSFLRDRIVMRDCVSGLGECAVTQTIAWVAEDCKFINVTNKFHGSTIGGPGSGFEGKRLGDKFEVYNFVAVPTIGTWAVGDRVPNQAGTVGQPKAWTLTTAPGTWTSEGNL